ncbi:hypothetical protein YPPY16_1886, partial [Yersinia pestis PY-16]
MRAVVKTREQSSRSILAAFLPLKLFRGESF